MNEERELTARVPLTPEQQAIIASNPEWFSAYISNALAAEWERRIDEMGEQLLRGEGTAQEPSEMARGYWARSGPARAGYAED